ncbi:MAG: sodium:solute symporter, partial [Planctomycetota bacterium]
VTGWDIRTIIVATGILVTLYTLVGGIEAVIWTDVVQSLVLSVGAVIVVVALLVGEPGAASLVETATANQKFSLGSSSLDLSQPTFWVVFTFGIFINLTNFGIDQNYIQRYHAAESDSAARHSLWFGATAYIPVSAMFFLIGTLLFGYYNSHPEQQAAIAQMAAATGKEGAIGDFALPHFMANHLPPGLGGLLVAALFAAAMSTIDTSLNSSATITLRDIFRKVATSGSDAEQMRVLRYATIFWGVIGTVVAVALSYDSRNILKIWWDLSGVFAGAMLGLFLLGIISRKADNLTAKISVAIGVAVIFWMSFSGAAWMPVEFRFPLHSLMTTVVGTLTIFLVGMILSQFRPLGERQD